MYSVFKVLVLVHSETLGWQPPVLSWVLKISICVCKYFRSVSIDVLVLVFFSVMYNCAIVCRIFIAHAEYHRTNCMWDWKGVTFPNYPSSTVCLGLLRKPWCWFFLPALRHTSIWLLRVGTRCMDWGVGTLRGDCSTSCGSRRLSVNGRCLFSCANLLSRSSPRPVHSLCSVTTWNPV